MNDVRMLIVFLTNNQVLEIRNRMENDEIHTLAQATTGWVTFRGLDNADNDTPVTIRGDMLAAYMILNRSSGLAVPSGSRP